MKGEWITLALEQKDHGASRGQGANTLGEQLKRLTKKCTEVSFQILRLSLTIAVSKNVFLEEKLNFSLTHSK